MSKQIRVDRERAREGGWTDEQIDAYEASVNGNGPQYDAIRSESEAMQKPNNPEAPWIDRSAENSAIIDAGLVNVGLDVASKAGIGAAAGLGGYGLYRAGKAMFGGGQPAAAPRVAPTMAPPTTPVAPAITPPTTAPTTTPGYGQPGPTAQPRVNFTPTAPAIEPIRVQSGSPWANPGAATQPNFTPAGTPTAPSAGLEPGGQRVTDFTRQTGQYAPPQDNFSRTMQNADRVLGQRPPLLPQQAAPQQAAPQASAPAQAQPGVMSSMLSAAAPYARFAGGAGLMTAPRNLNTGEQQQLNQLYPERAQQAQVARSAIQAAGRQPTSQADLDQMIRAAAAKRALMMGQQRQ